VQVLDRRSKREQPLKGLKPSDPMSLTINALADFCTHFFLKLRIPFSCEK
jgi:hypothetical protein